MDSGSSFSRSHSVWLAQMVVASKEEELRTVAAELQSEQRERQVERSELEARLSAAEARHREAEEGARMRLLELQTLGEIRTCRQRVQRARRKWDVPRAHQNVRSRAHDGRWRGPSDTRNAIKRAPGCHVCT